MMPKFSSVDVLFKRTPEGWTFNSSYPRFFGPRSIYLLTRAEKAALEERLNRAALGSRVLVYMFVMLGALVLFIVPDFVARLEAGSLEAWLLVCVVSIVLTSARIPVILFAHYRIVQPVLRAARCNGLAQPDLFGFVILKEVIKRYTERKSVTGLIIWSVLLLLFSTYSVIAYAVVLPAWSPLMLFATIVSWIATLCYASLIVFKLRARRPER